MEIFGIHDPDRYRCLTHLRVGLSNLKEYKFRHNSNDSTESMCLFNDGLEDAAHFLLLCHEHSTHSGTVFDKVSDRSLLYDVIIFFHILNKNESFHFFFAAMSSLAILQISIYC